MGDDAAARDRIAERGIPIPRYRANVRSVLLAWLYGFIGLLLPIWLRRWFRRPLPAGAREVALYVARRIVLGVVALAVGDRFVRGWARTAKEADELKERMRSELGR